MSGVTRKRVRTSKSVSNAPFEEDRQEVKPSPQSTKEKQSARLMKRKRVVAHRIDDDDDGNNDDVNRHNNDEYEEDRRHAGADAADGEPNGCESESASHHTPRHDATSSHPRRKHKDKVISSSATSTSDESADLFTLSTSALLTEVAVDYTAHSPLVSFVHRIRQHMDNIQPFTYTFDHTRKTSHDNRHWFTLPNSLSLEPQSSLPLLSQRNQTFTLMKPSAINIIGSYLHRIQLKSLYPRIDIALTLPLSFTDINDHFDFLYFYSRAAYLYGLQQSLTKTMSLLNIQSITIEYLHGCMYKPVLIIRPSLTGSSSRFYIRILPVWAEDVFAAKKLNVLRNNVRHKSVDASINSSSSSNGHIHIDVATVSAINGGIATTYYNSLLAEDSAAAVMSHFQQLHDMYTTSPHTVTAMKLITVWARCRHLIPLTQSKSKSVKTESETASEQIANSNTVDGHDRITPFIISMLLLHLYKTQPTVSLMRPELIIRTYFAAIAKIDMSQNGGLVLGQSLQPPSSTTSSSINDDVLTNFRTALFPVIFIDPAVPINLTAHVSTAAYLDFQRHVNQTLNVLSLDENAMFPPLFLTPRTFESSHDMFLHITLPTTKPSTSVASLYHMPTLDQIALHARAVYDILTRVFTDRIAYMNIQATSSQPTSIDVGIVLSAPSNYQRLVDSGPSADDAAASKSFRSFWGDKSELRRFKDGRIIEAVLWPIDTDGYGILQMTQYILQRHLHIESKHVTMIGAQLDKFMLIRHVSLPARTNTKYHTRIEDISLSERESIDKSLIVSEPRISPLKALPLLQAAYTKFSSQLRALDLPLGILSLTAVHEAMRLTSPFPPQPHPALLHTQTSTAPKSSELARLAHHSESLEYIPVLLTFESSSRWPMDLVAMQRVKAAFYIHMQQTYAENHQSTLILPPAVAYTHVDFFVDGFAFRVTIYDERERQLFIDREKAALETPNPLLSADDANNNIAVTNNNQKKKQNKGAKPNDETSALSVSNPHLLQQQYRREYDDWTLTHVLRPWLQAHIRAFSMDAVYANWYPQLCRVAKRWLSSHMFLSHIPVEAVDLICMHILIQQTTVHKRTSSLPQSLIACLYLFLSALIEFNWDEEMIMIDVTRSHGQDATQVSAGSSSDSDPVVGGITTELNERMIGAFKKQRREGTGAAMYIATELDPESTYLTKNTPTVDMLHKLIKYGRSSRSYLHGLVNDMGLRPLTHWMTLFKTPLNVFDLIITLKPHTLPHHHIALALHWDNHGATTSMETDTKANRGGFVAPFDATNASNNGTINTSSQQSYVGFDVHILYLIALRQQFGAYALFSMDMYGGNVIGVQWRQDNPLIQSRSWQVKHSGYSVATITDDNKSIMSRLNIPEMIADMRALGDGIVDSISLQSN